MPRFLIASDKFKGSLTAPQACEAMARGIQRRFPGAEIDLCPIADGGEGFVDAILSASHGRRVKVPCQDALGRDIEASYGVLESPEGKTAILEMAEAAGLWRLANDEHFPMDSHTYGVGQLLRHAAAIEKADHIVIGIGGSATNDGGAGMLAALGARFLDAAGKTLQPTPRALQSLDRIDLRDIIALPPITVACDVTNPLLGQRGATRVFGPQKGATEEDFVPLENALLRIVCCSDGREDSEAPGAGAAGGLGFALLHFLDAKLTPGFDLVARTVNLPARIAWADCVLTGEGSLDVQSLGGKGPAGVALQAILAAKPIVAVVGRVDQEIRSSGLFHHITAVLEKGYSLAECLHRGAEIVEHETAHLDWDADLALFFTRATREPLL